MSISLRKKLFSIVLSTGIFVSLAMVFAAILRVPLDQSAVGATAMGLMVSGFEMFYVQGHRGRWLRAMHPIKSIMIYSAIIMIFFLIVMHLNHFAFGRWHLLGNTYARLPTIIPLLFVVSIAAIMMLRIIGYLGARNLFYLLIGRYHRAVIERKVILFLDMAGSTVLAEELGPIQIRALIGKFLFDVSKPITDYGGDIYRYTGDGVVATWDWGHAFDGGQVLGAIDAIREVVERERPYYETAFGHHPRYRIGVHGGEIVISEEGDTKRDIGHYGDTVNIAARMEQKAKELGHDCILTAAVVGLLGGAGPRFEALGVVTVRGIAEPIEIYGLKAILPE